MQYVGNDLIAKFFHPNVSVNIAGETALNLKIQMMAGHNFDKRFSTKG